jgi:Fe-S-cluster-containing dehydrogenase component
MGVSRRDFLKAAAGGTLAVAASLTPSPVLARAPKARLPEAKGMLFDSTVCIGCRVCMVACKEYNNLPPEFSRPTDVWDNPANLSDKTYNIIKLYQQGAPMTKDQEIDGFAFVKRSCMHCVDPSCVSACPVTALTKDHVTGIVKYNKDLCIGCRYCQVACPFNIPKFQWESAFPQIKKCQLCDHRMAEGGYAACCEFCPTGASIYGNVLDLIEESKRRLALPVGKEAPYPLRRVDSGDMNVRLVTPYINHIYGYKEGGGTQVMLLSNVPVTKMGYPDLPEESTASHSETLMHTLYKGMIAPYVVLGGLFYVIYKNTGKKDLP